MNINSENLFSKQNHRLFLGGIILALILPLISFAPLLDPPSWGQTILFRLLVSLLLIGTIWHILTKRIQITPPQGALKLLLTLLGSLVGVFFLSTLFSLDQHFSFWGDPIRAWGFLNYLFYAVFALLLLWFAKNREWNYIWHTLLGTGILLTGVTLIQQFSLLPSFYQPYQADPSGTLGNPRFVSLFLLPLIFIMLGLGFQARTILKRFLYLGIIAIFLIGLLVTVSRSAFVGLAIVLPLFFLLYPFNDIRKKLLGGAIILAGTCFLGYVAISPTPPPPFQQHPFATYVWSRASLEQVVQDVRIPAWGVFIKAAKDRPFLGYGMYNSSIAFDTYYDPTLPIPHAARWWDSAHNLFIDIAVWSGIPGITLFITFLGALFWHLQRIKKQQHLKIAAHATQAALLSYLVHNFFSFDVFATYLIFFTLLAYAFFLISKAYQSEQESPHSSSFLKIRWAYNHPALITFSLIALFLIFAWTANARPLFANADVNASIRSTEQNQCKETIETYEALLPTDTFIDHYARLEYIKTIRHCLRYAGSLATENLLIEKAIQQIEQNVQIRPSYIQNWLLLGELFTLAAERTQNQEEKLLLGEKAKEAFNKAKELSPKHQATYVNIAETELILQNSAKAKEQAQYCLTINDSYEDCWWVLGRAEYSAKNENAGKAAIEKAISLGYGYQSETSAKQLLQAYLAVERYDLLVPIYDQLIRFQPDSFEYRAGMAAAYLEAGNSYQAGVAAKVALELAPENAQQEVLRFLEQLAATIQ